MPGTRAQAKNIIDTIAGYSNAAVTANQVLQEWVAIAFGRLTGIKFYAVTAGSGAGNTVADVLINGTSVWAAAGSKPTLLGTATGEFANAVPDPNNRSVRPGDRITLQVNSIPATTGHARVMATVALEGNA
jgi:hypothetical protein